MDPSEFNLARLTQLLLTDSDWVPPINTLPSGCRTIACISGFPTVAAKLLSSEPSLFSRAIPKRDMPLTLVNLPATSTLPSDCNATELINAGFASNCTSGLLKPGSDCPFVRNRATDATVPCDLPAASTLPSSWITKEDIKKPVPALSNGDATRLPVGSNVTIHWPPLTSKLPSDSRASANTSTLG